MKNFDDITKAPSFAELHIERALNAVIKTPGKASNPALSPSGLSCQRAAAFKLSGAVCKDEEETYESSLPATVGSFLHERIQTYLRHDSIWVDVEDFVKSHPHLGLTVRGTQKIDGEVSLLFSGVRNGKKVSPPFSFQCDGIVCIDGEYYIVEIKSESEKAWQARTAPNPGHAEQGTAYAFLYGIKKILWIYVSRESFGTHRKIYEQEIPDTRVEQFVATVQSIGNAVLTNSISTLPKARNCHWCAFSDVCKELDAMSK